MLVMNSTARMATWRISILGIGASVVFFCLSFDYDAADRLFRWMIPLFLGFFVLQAFMLFHHRASTGTWRWRWNELTEGKPIWVVVCYYMLMASYIGYFLWSAHASSLGSAAIVDGQYVLKSHGQPLKELSADEYFHLRSQDFRTLAILLIGMFFVHAVYWYYPESKRATADNT